MSKKDDSNSVRNRMLYEAAHRNKDLFGVMSFGLINQKNILFRQNGACFGKKNYPTYEVICHCIMVFGCFTAVSTLLKYYASSVMD